MADSALVAAFQDYAAERFRMPSMVWSAEQVFALLATRYAGKTHMRDRRLAALFELATPEEMERIQTTAAHLRE